MDLVQHAIREGRFAIRDAAAQWSPLRVRVGPSKEALDPSCRPVDAVDNYPLIDGQGRGPCLSHTCRPRKHVYGCFRAVQTGSAAAKSPPAAPSGTES